MRIFVASAYYSYRGMFVWLIPSMWVAQKLLIPLTQVAFFSLIGAYGGAQPLDFYLIGNAMITASQACTFIALAINEERALGTLLYLTASPANRLALFFGRASIHIVEGILHVIAAFAWAAIAFGLHLPVTSWGSIVLVIIVGTFAISGLGLLLGGLAYVSLDVNISLNAVYFGVLLLSGANVPMEELPSWLALISQALPLTRSVAAARLAAGGAPLSDIFPLLAGEVGVGTAYALAGFLFFQRLEIQSRRKGMLEGI